MPDRSPNHLSRFTDLDTFLVRNAPELLELPEREPFPEPLRRTSWGAAMPQSPEEWQYHRSLESLWAMLPPVVAYRGGQDIARGIGEGSPGTALWGAGQVGLAALPFFAWSRPTARATAPVRETPAPPPTYSGPWTPGYLDDWLAHRPHIPRHEINTTAALGRPLPPRRVAPEQPQAPIHWLDDFLWPGVGRRPETPEEWRTYWRRTAANLTAMEAVGVAAYLGRKAWRDRRDTPETDARR